MRRETAMTNRPHILMVTHRFPYPPDRGDRIRTWHLLDELTGHADVSLACLSDEPIHVANWEVVYRRVRKLTIHPLGKNAAISGLAQSFKTGRSVTEQMFYSAAMHRTIREWAEDAEFDAALAVCSSTARYLEDLPIARRVVDLIDVDSRKWADYAAHASGLRRWVYQREAGKLAQYEKELAQQYELAVTCDREAQILAEIAPGANLTVARNGAAGDQGKMIAGRCEPTVVFTGMLDYKPNVDGLAWFVNEVWPNVMAEMPGARFDIVGRGAGRTVKTLAATPGVKLVGAVDDTQPYLEQARVAVAPLHIARGVQNKALQAMAAARPVVATAEVRAGLAVDGHCPCIVPESTAQWSKTLIELLSHAPLASALGARGRLFIEQHYEWSHTLGPLLAVLLPATRRPTSILSTVSPTRVAA